MNSGRARARAGLLAAGFTLAACAPLAGQLRLVPDTLTRARLEELKTREVMLELGNTWAVPIVTVRLEPAARARIREGTAGTWGFQGVTVLADWDEQGTVRWMEWSGEASLPPGAVHSAFLFMTLADMSSGEYRFPLRLTFADSGVLDTAVRVHVARSLPSRTRVTILWGLIGLGWLIVMAVWWHRTASAATVTLWVALTAGVAGGSHANGRADSRTSVVDLSHRPDAGSPIRSSRVS